MRIRPVKLLVVDNTPHGRHNPTRHKGLKDIACLIVDNKEPGKRAEGTKFEYGPNKQSDASKKFTLQSRPSYCLSLALAKML